MKRRAAHEQPVSHIDPVSDDELLEDGSEVGEEIRATLAALMPWGVSILAHVGLIVIAFFLVWQTIIEKPEEQSVIPRLSQSPEVTAPSIPIEEPEQEEAGGGAAFSVVVTQVEPLEITTVGNDFSAPQLVISDSFSDFNDKFKGPKTGKPDPGFFGGIGADKVVFLIDASGSMVDVLPFVIDELKRVVSGMQPVKVGKRTIEKEATVIFFSGKGVHEVPGGGGVRGLRAVTPEFKTQIREWVSLENFNFDTGGRGSAHVEAALIRALSYKPELVILLSDNLTGGGQGATQHELMQDDLLDLIHKHNKANPPARFNTVQFLYEDPLVRHGLQGTLDRIAEETGGEPRFVSQQQLNLR